MSRSSKAQRVKQNDRASGSDASSGAAAAAAAADDDDGDADIGAAAAVLVDADTAEDVPEDGADEAEEEERSSSE